MTFEQWWDSEARTPAPNTYKNWEESCRLAWVAAQAEWLKDRGIPHQVDGKRIIVSRFEVEI